MRKGGKLSAGKEFLITLSGPLMGFFLFFLSIAFLAILGPEESRWKIAGEAFAQINFVWTLFNLFPILPMDGGVLVQIVLGRWLGRKGILLSLLSSLLFSILLGLSAFLFQQLLIGSLLFLFAFENYQNWKKFREEELSEEDREWMGEIEEGVEAVREGNRDEALLLFSNIRKRGGKGKASLLAAEYGAEILAQEGRERELYEWLFPLREKVSLPSLSLLQKAAYQLGEWEGVIEAGKKIYENIPSSHTAFLNACAHAARGEAVPAVGWLRAAEQLGTRVSDSFLDQREWDPIRATKIFQNWLNQERQRG